MDATRRRSAPATAGEQSTSSWTAAAIASSNSRHRRTARDETGNARFGPGDDVVVGLADGERDDRERRPRLAQRARGAEAVRQVEIEQRDVRRRQQSLELLARGAKRGGAADDVETRIAAQRIDDPVAVQTDAHEDEDLDIGPQQRVPGIHGEIPPPSRLVACRDLSQPAGGLSTCTVCSVTRRGED